MKSSWWRPGTKRPLASDTVAVTLISSTPLLKRKPCVSPSGRTGAGAGVCGCCACSETTSSATAAHFRLLTSDFRLLTFMPFVQVRNHALVGPEAYAVLADVVDARHGDDERRFAAGPQRRRFHGGVSAGEIPAVGREEHHHRVQPIHPRARLRVADYAAHGQLIADAFVSKRDQLERTHRGRRGRMRGLWRMPESAASQNRHRDRRAEHERAAADDDEQARAG